MSLSALIVPNIFCQPLVRRYNMTFNTNTNTNTNTCFKFKKCKIISVNSIIIVNNNSHIA
jgi:hypothetical protein